MEKLESVGSEFKPHKGLFNFEDFFNHLISRIRFKIGKTQLPILCTGKLGPVCENPEFQTEKGHLDSARISFQGPIVRIPKLKIEVCPYFASLHVYNAQNKYTQN